jgi:hypothetical protein
MVTLFGGCGMDNFDTSTLHVPISRCPSPAKAGAMETSIIRTLEMTAAVRPMMTLLFLLAGPL